MTLYTSLISFYNLQDDLATTNVLDGVGSYDGTLAGGDNTEDLSEAGKIGLGLDLNGVDDYINVDGTLAVIANDTVGTFAGWVKPVDATPAGPEIFFSVTDASASTGTNFYIESSGKLTATLQQAGAVKFIVTTDNAVFSDGTWAHVAIVQNGTAPVLYVNGSAVAITFSDQTDKTAWLGDMTNLDSVRFGDQTFNSSGENLFFAGVTNFFGIWSTNLSSALIGELYNSNTGLAYPFPIDNTVNIAAALTLSLTETTPVYWIIVPSLSLSSGLNLATPTYEGGPPSLTGGIGTSAITTNYPVSEGLMGTYQKQTGRYPHLIAEECDLTPHSARVGL